jgi:hypothetical protein
MDHPLVLVHGVGVGKLPVTFCTFDHDAFVEDTDVLRQLGPDSVGLGTLVTVVSLLHAM